MISANTTFEFLTTSFSFPLVVAIVTFLFLKQERQLLGEKDRTMGTGEGFTLRANRPAVSLLKRIHEVPTLKTRVRSKMADEIA